MPWGHRHREQEDIYVAVAGFGRAKLDDEVIEIDTWDALRVAPAVIRSFEAGPDGLDLICIGGRKPDGPDSVGIQTSGISTVLPMRPTSTNPSIALRGMRRHPVTPVSYTG